MSVFRFLHTDALRLGSPVSGLAHCPEWLRRVASSAVRTSVKKIIEAAVASRCRFVLIAGRLTESEQDLELAVSWLARQAALLKEQGIQLVLTGHPESDFSSLRHLGAVLVAAHQRLDVCCTALGGLDLMVTPRSQPARSGALGIETDVRASARPLADLAYVSIPAIAGTAASNSADGVVAAHDRFLRISAGCPQAIRASEQGAFGCQLVEIDTDQQRMTARFCPTDVLRFSQELITCLPGMQAAQLSELLHERSRAVAVAGRGTTIVDWVIDGELSLTFPSRESLCEEDLLRDLRESLYAGHSGVWPCRISFSENCTLNVSGFRESLIPEFSSLVRQRLRSTEPASAVARDLIGLPLGGRSEATVGLRALQRVA